MNYITSSRLVCATWERSRESRRQQEVEVSGKQGKGGGKEGGREKLMAQACNTFQAIQEVKAGRL